ncbi:DUF6799 domain-containing protein [Flavobacterium sinopsychrotolerans]|uniref:DUF6799 domain-containing protein n=1 Tax=Flavobacterium sinopsychrotolerans TaxID=604089 RepID=A0A1H8LVW2_9FLAO|nr:DUF6799 domain-containing protein [Flavobacterium sinopsychrotolerans]SEO09257.1 hypothetical protein SAMN04487942_1704 [Flavobacterium sinopsychrotolerans]
MKKVIFISVAFCFSMCLFAQKDSTKNKMNHDDTNRHKMTKGINGQTTYTSFPDGVMMKNGKLMMVKQGKRTMLDHEMAMGNGTKVMPDGTVMKKDGTKMMMKEGQHMDMAGHTRNTKTKKIISRKTTIKETTTNKKKDMYLLPNDKIKKDSLK